MKPFIVLKLNKAIQAFSSIVFTSDSYEDAKQYTDIMCRNEPLPDYTYCVVRYYYGNGKRETIDK